MIWFDASTAARIQENRLRISSKRNWCLICASTIFSYNSWSNLLSVTSRFVFNIIIEASARISFPVSFTNIVDLGGRLCENHIDKRINIGLQWSFQRGSNFFSIFF